jgi:hypothetical protein
MKVVIFKPLRRIKKTGKITVASYMQWRKVKTSDYNNFSLIIDDEYKSFPKDEYVYDHKGENLFWYNFKNPQDVPKMNISIQSICERFGISTEHLEGEEWKIADIDIFRQLYPNVADWKIHF